MLTTLHTLSVFLLIVAVLVLLYVFFRRICLLFSGVIFFIVNSLFVFISGCVQHFVHNTAFVVHIRSPPF